MTDPQDKITQEELIDLFGDRMPVEAVALLFNAPDGWTTGQVRAEVRRMADRQELNRLMKEVAGKTMTPEEVRAQKISFVYGQLMDCAPHVTKEQIAEWVDETEEPMTTQPPKEPQVRSPLAGADSLKPCPFCGGEAWYPPTNRQFGNPHQCRSCCAEGPDPLHGVHWNDRALSAPTPPAVRCAECDCENGGADCNWIATPPADVAGLAKRYNETCQYTTEGWPEALMVAVPEGRYVNFTDYNTLSARVAELEETLARLDQYLSSLDDGPQSTSVIDEICGIVHGRKDITRAKAAEAALAEARDRALEEAARACIEYANGLVSDNGSYWMATTLPAAIRAMKGKP